MTTKNKLNNGVMREELIRPRKMFAKFLNITKKDVVRYFNHVPRRRIKCPACLSANTKLMFKKEGFNFDSCTNCRTLFVNPRPDVKAFDRFYQSGLSVRFLADVAYKKTLNARRRWVTQPKIELVNGLISSYYREDSRVTLIDIGAGNGTFCKDLYRSTTKKLHVMAVEPSPPAVQNCRNNGLLVINKPFEAVI